MYYVGIKEIFSQLRTAVSYKQVIAKAHLTQCPFFRCPGNGDRGQLPSDVQQRDAGPPREQGQRDGRPGGLRLRPPAQLETVGVAACMHVSK